MLSREPPFDVQLNVHHLNNCLITLLQMYDEVRKGTAHQDASTADLLVHEAEFRSYVLVLAIGEIGAAQSDVTDLNCHKVIERRGIADSQPVAAALCLLTAACCGYYRRFFRVLQRRATLLQACLASNIMSQIRRRALAVMDKVYLKQEKYCAADVVDVLALNDVDHCVQFCSTYGLPVVQVDGKGPCIVLKDPATKKDRCVPKLATADSVVVRKWPEGVTNLTLVTRSPSSAETS